MNDFEFDALKQASNYRAALIREFAPCLKGAVTEIGAGVGQMTTELLNVPNISCLLSIEPDVAFCEKNRAMNPGVSVLTGTINDVERGSVWDAIFSINVLEHIEDDAQELAQYAELLREKRGALCLLVPARPEIYAPIDKDFGHHRRYTKKDLRERLIRAGFTVERLDYFNAVGYFAWWWNFCVLKKRVFEPGKVRLFDKVIFPVSHFWESKIMRPCIWQNLLVVARSCLR